MSNSDLKEQLATKLPADAENMQAIERGYLFEAYDAEIYVCAEASPLLAQLPKPKDVFKAPSCAFDGLDITYFYPGFELTTYPENGVEHVLSIILTDDSVVTPEGLYIGCMVENVKKAYGEDFTQSGDQLSYSRGKGSLIFTFEGNLVIGILYIRE
ncbi:MAG: hypothetical protein FWG61_07355 [Firmicutes bacterium]|nr:hypothetical protein [Bacillota bacterium]